MALQLVGAGRHGPPPAPTLPAWRVVWVECPSDQLITWCERCSTWHAHGGGKAKGDGDGHREAHGPRGTCWPAGYLLQEVGKADQALLEAYRAGRSPLMVLACRA